VLIEVGLSAIVVVVVAVAVAVIVVVVVVVRTKIVLHEHGFGQRHGSLYLLQRVESSSVVLFLRPFRSKDGWESCVNRVTKLCLCRRQSRSTIPN